VRKGSGGRRRQSSASSTLEGLSNSGDEHSSITNSDTTKPVNEASKRSDIQARLAARRSKRNSGDDIYQSTVAPTRHSSETVQRSTGHSGDIPYRSTVAPTRHSSETLPHKRTTKSTKHARHSSETLHRSTEASNEPRTSRHGQKTSPRRSSDGVRGSVANKYKEAIAKESIANPPGRRKSTDRAKATAEVQTSQSSRRSTSSGEIPNAPSVPEPYESRGSQKPIPKPEPLPSRASSTGAISERLRERREARERDRIEREEQYGLKGLSSTEAEPMQSNNKDVPAERSISRDENKSRAVKRNITACQLMISDDEVDHATGEEWSIRLCVISAMDLPSNVVPNMPLCPILKMGLVKLPANLQHENAKEKKSATSVIMEELGDNGIEAVKSAKVRSTTHKILSKRDNGTVDFHQEYRWDNLKEPRGLGLCVELFARAVRTPSNYMLSPPATPQHEANDETESSRPTGGSGAPATRGVNRTSSLEVSGATRRGSIWNRASKKQETEMQAAEAAAAVARMLLDDNGTEAKNDGELQPVSTKVSESTNFGYDVSLRSATESLSTDMTRDVRLGSVVIPLTRLTKGKSMNRNEAVRLEQWHQLETGEESSDSGSQRRKPSVFLEISLSSSEALDDSEDEFEEEHDIDNDIKKSRHNVSFSRRKCIEALNQTGEQESKKEKPKTEDPVLEPGVVDFVAVIGCKDIGNQKNDRGMNGWVKTTPECVVMEQFPPNNEFHLKSGRKALLPEMLQWFCFPEGARLWRGTAPPSYSDLNLERNPSASYQNVASSAAAFDACLDCTTSFSWFVIASNSDEYGSSLVKTYTAVIRFYAPAPTGIDSTQDDFAQAIMGGKSNLPRSRSVKRLWVPMAICMTSNLPIIGVMEALLLRTCEELATIPDGIASTKLGEIQQAIGNIILNYQKPISGAVNCSVPFFTGDRFLLSLSPRVCLPPLPHGRAVVSAIRLLGTEGLKYLIAAVLSECKILLHSYDIAELSMVAEVITTLVYPFAWSLPYIPVLPIGMIEFVEAPLSYLLGTHSNNLKLIEPGALDDTVVFDLNKEFSSAEYSPEKVKSKSIGSKHPPPLPASIAANLSNAVYKLLHAEEQMEEEYGESDLLEQSFPRLENESLAEREFRVTVSIEICGLLRGYQDCVGPVFNRDKFLKMSPALYEERREYKIIGGRPNGRNAIAEKTKILSSRSKRFLSSLISGQNFQQFLETLDSEEATFFHEVLEIIDESASDRKPMKRSSSDEFGFSQGDKNVALLMKSLQKNEDKIPTFCVEKDREDETLMSLMFDEGEFDTFDNLYHNPDDMDLEKQNPLKFMKSLLSPIEIESTTSVSDSGMQAMSMEYLEKLETTPWQYKSLFGDLSQHIKTNDKMKLREAIGERRFRAWKLARDKKSNHEEDLPFLSESTTESAKQGSALNLTTLVTSAKNDSSTLSSDTIQSRMSSQTPAQQRIAAAKSRDIIRRCLDRANIVQTSESEQLNPFMENGRDLLAEAEKALRNPSAKLFLVSILAQRSRLDNKRTRTMRQNAAVVNSASRLDHIAFDCLIRLSCAMLDSCMEYKEFEMAYRLLTNSAGFIMVQEVDSFKEDENDEFGNEQSMIVITMTSRIGLHPIFADIGVWEAVMVLHLCDRKVVKRSGEFKSYGAESDDEEEEEEVEYEAAVATLYEMVGYGIPGEELSRFAMRASQEHGWFCDDRGRQLLMLARRICIRRDQADMGGTGNTGDIDMVRKGPDVSDTNATISEWSSQDKTSFMWRDVAWCHPAAPSRTALVKSDGSDTDLDMILSVDNFMKRTPVTALASFGSSIVASGGLDGGVFLAHSITVGPRTENSSAGCDKYPKVRGIHLDWGSASRARTGSTSDGEYGVGAVSCLAAAYGDSSHDSNPSSTKDTRDAIDEIDIAESMEGSRIIAGTTAGDLRVWSVKDIYSSISMAKNEQDGRNIHTASRFKYSLRGRALSGHRGGVTCIDVPSQVYRPDSLVTGGADGLIKLWALRAPTGSRRTNASSSNEADMGGSAGQQHRGRGGDALSTLSGHAGRILCIKTAWHGDHLISGGADRTIRVWDLASSGGKCIHRLSGHFGWITNVQYWGPNTIVSASTDRSVALWDARVRSSPLFILRNHRSPISDLLVGSRTDPHMVSAAADGSIATWDFRSLSDTSATEQPGKKDCPSNGCKIVRLPSASIRHNANMQDRAVGSVNLSRDVTDPINSFLSVGSDAIMRKWNITTGNIVDESPTGHCDTITSFESYAQNHGFAAMNPTDFRGENSPAITDKGFLTSSLDGTIRMRKLVGTNDA
jgi:WD40 repeat protein